MDLTMFNFYHFNKAEYIHDSKSGQLQCMTYLTNPNFVYYNFLACSQYNSNFNKFKNVNFRIIILTANSCTLLTQSFILNTKY